MNSTAAPSGPLSKFDKGSTLEEIKEMSGIGGGDCMPFRASTAKMERKPLKMNVRCPSAVQILRNSQFKKPSFELRNSKKRRTKHRTTNFSA